MVAMMSLWLPILLSAVAVFIVSSIVHMMLPLHRNDVSAVPRADEVQDALRKFAIPPGDYALPYAGGMEAMRSPAFAEKMKAGPVLWMTVMPNGFGNMGVQLTQWFVYSIVVAALSAYVARHSLPPGAHYVRVFRIVGITSFMSYGVGLWQNTIWYKRNVFTTIKYSFDALLFALASAAVFGWLWPK